MEFYLHSNFPHHFFFLLLFVSFAVKRVNLWSTISSVSFWILCHFLIAWHFIVWYSNANENEKKYFKRNVKFLFFSTQKHICATQQITEDWISYVFGRFDTFSIKFFFIKSYIVLHRYISRIICEIFIFDAREQRIHIKCSVDFVWSRYNRFRNKINKRQDISFKCFRKKKKNIMK